jgi:hypothetical protein
MIAKPQVSFTFVLAGVSFAVLRFGNKEPRCMGHASPRHSQTTDRICNGNHLLLARHALGHSLVPHDGHPPGTGVDGLFLGTMEGLTSTHAPIGYLTHS